MDSISRIKAEFQEKGVRVPLELIDELESKYNAPAISTGRMVLCLDSPRGDGELIPVFIVNGKRGSISPYSIVKNPSGKFEVWKNGSKYAGVTLIERPRFYDRLTSERVHMSKVAVIVGPGHLRSVANQRCIYQQAGQACKFCAVQYWWNAAQIKQSSRIAESVEEAFKEGAAQHVSLTTATLDVPDRGLAGLVEAARLISSRVSIPIMIESEPVPDHTLLKALLTEAKQCGVKSISINVECFDQGLRENAMPAKGKIPLREYSENWQICTDIFGKNEVSTVVVVGIGEDDGSIIRGVEKTAAQGVITFLVPHSPAIGAIYEDMQPPSASRMLRLYEKAVNIYKKYDLDLCACTAGCVRGGGFSAIKDIARFGI